MKTIEKNDRQKERKKERKKGKKEKPLVNDFGPDPSHYSSVVIRAYSVTANPRGRNNWWLLACLLETSFFLPPFEWPYSINLMTPIDADKPLTKKRCIRTHR